MIIKPVCLVGLEYVILQHGALTDMFWYSCVVLMNLTFQSFIFSLMITLKVAAALISLIDPETKSGTVLLIRQDGTMQQPFTKNKALQGLNQNGGYSGGGGSLVPAHGPPSRQRQQAAVSWVTQNWPTTYKKVCMYAWGFALSDRR